MTTATAVKKRSSDIDLDAELADARAQVERLREHRGRLSLPALSDEAVAAELENVESELGSAERRQARLELAGPERERLEIEDRERAEAEHRAALAAKIDKFDGECGRLASACDEKLSEAAKSIAELSEVWNRRRAARGEMQIALGSTTADGGGPITPVLQRAMLFHLGAAGLERGTLECLDAGPGDLEPLAAREQPTQE